MRAVTLTKKQIKRAAAIAAAVLAGAAAAITAAVTSVNTSAAQRLTPIYRVNYEDRTDKKIAVTFDVAWENSNTAELIDILEDAGAKATFFVTGDFCDRHPEDVRQFAQAGHEIGNHSDKHPHVEGMNVNDFINDTRECQKKIEMITGYAPAVYRAPYGEYDDNLLITAEGMGLKVIQWDADSVDWDDAAVSDIKKRILGKTEAGSILLFHNDLKNTAQALPDILSELKTRGFEFVTVSELIYAENYYIDSKGEQRLLPESERKLSQSSIDAVLAKYSDRIKAAGITDEQLKQIVSALKKGDVSTLDESIQPLAQEVMAQAKKIPVQNTPSTSVPLTSSEEK